MITKDKLQIYSFYNGDMDMFARLANNKDKSIISEKDWMFIDELVQNIELLNKGLLSVQMEINVKNDIKNNIPDNETIDMLFSIVHIRIS